jgi:hypothetical protein
MLGSLRLEISLHRIIPARLKTFPAGVFRASFNYSVVKEPVSPAVYTRKVLMVHPKSDKSYRISAELFSDAVTDNPGFRELAAGRGVFAERKRAGAALTVRNEASNSKA